MRNKIMEKEKRETFVLFKGGQIKKIKNKKERRRGEKE